MVEYWPPITLEELSKKYEYLLFDSSALGFSLDNTNEIKENSLQIINSKKEVKHLNSVRDFLEEDGRIYLIREVEKEILVPSAYFNREPSSGFYAGVRNEGKGARASLHAALEYKRTKFYRSIINRNKKNEGLCKLINKNGGIVEFSEDERRYHSYLQSRYGWAKKEDWGRKRKKISGVDFNLVNTSFTFFKYRGSTSLVCNDYPAFLFWNYLFKKERGEKGKLDFYTRNNINGYVLEGFGKNLLETSN